MTAPGSSLADPNLGVGVTRGVREDLRKRDHVEPAVGRLCRGRHEALQEQVPERLVVAVQLAVAGDDEHRRSPVREGLRQPGGDPLSGEAVRIGGDRRIE